MQYLYAGVIHQIYQRNPAVTTKEAMQGLNISYKIASSCLTALKWLDDNNKLHDVTEEIAK